MITVTIDKDLKLEVPEGITLLDLIKVYIKSPVSLILAAKVNNEIKELTYALNRNCNVEFIYITDEDGMRIYRRSLLFIMIKAVHDLFPKREVHVGHTISKGLYCEIIGNTELTCGEVYQIEQRMYEIVDMKLEFKKHEITLDEAKDLFIKMNRKDRFLSLDFRQKPHVTIYSFGDVIDYFYGYMAPHSGYIKSFALKYYSPGLILMYPEKTNPDKIPEFVEQKKLFNILKEYKTWNKIINFENISHINHMVKSSNIGDVIRISEALHEKKIANIADMIASNSNSKRLILISGPSSSGKTTFAHRLSIQLRVNGIVPITLSLDDYFKNRDQSPLDENGQYDFERIEAIDIDLFNEDLYKLLRGCEVEIPIFNFITGRREKTGRKLCINEKQMIIIEGIHGLNEKLTSSIPGKNKFKIYISALTSLSIDSHNRIPSTDTRMIRRIVRDHKYRGWNAENTIKNWPSVRRGEEKYIFPFQEEADIMFNSSLIYELCVLKPFAEPLLAEVDNLSPEYTEAKRLIEFLGSFQAVDTHEIPFNSILREFIGGSCFYNA